MNMIMTMMRTGLFFQREEPGSEPGNSLFLSLTDKTLERRLSEQSLKV